LIKEGTTVHAIGLFSGDPTGSNINRTMPDITLRSRTAADFFHSDLVVQIVNLPAIQIKKKRT